MSAILRGTPIGNLPEPGELEGEDQIVAYRKSDGVAYRSDVSALAMVSVLDRVYPVGAIYMSVNASSPALLFGGEWEQIKGRFLLSASDDHTVGETGGAETVALASGNIPSHTHSIPALSGTAASAGNHTHSLQYYPNEVAAGSSYTRLHTSGTASTTGPVNSAGAHTHSVTTTASNTGSTGSGTAHDNMPPYMTVYMWQRTA